MQRIITSTTLLLLVLIQCQAESISWNKWKSKYGKQYNPKEDYEHWKIWDTNRKMIKNHNRKFERGLESYALTLNQYSDMNSEQLRKIFNPIEYESQASSRPTGHETSRGWTSNTDIPDNWDWREHGLVTEVKDQGLCVCGNSFAAVGALEGQYAKKGMKHISLSAQQINDCSGLGCSGASLQETYDYLLNNGIQENATYPWVGGTHSCNYREKYAVLNITGYTHIQSGNELELKKHVYQYGPISVTIKFPIQMVHYKGGIVDLEPCLAYFGDQPLLVVGYGVENGTDYWLLKGSYGTDWGIQGYAKLRRNKNNMCQIASKAFYPLV